MSILLILGAFMCVCFFSCLVLVLVIEKHTKANEIVGIIIASSGLILSVFFGIVAKNLV